MRTLLAASLFALLLTPTLAEASSCSGSSDSSSSFDDSSSDTSSYSVDDTPAAPCDEACTQYNAWRAQHMPPVKLEIGFLSRSFANPLRGGTSSVSHEGTSYGFRVTMPTESRDAMDNAFGGVVRLTGRLPAGFYAGGEVELGGVQTADAVVEMSSQSTVMPTVAPGSVIMLGANAVLGVGGHLGQSVEVGVEAAAGVRGIGYTFDSQLGACQSSASMWEAQGVLEARARGTLWLGPKMSLTAFAGRSFVDDGLMGGISFGFSNQPFGM